MARLRHSGDGLFLAVNSSALVVSFFRARKLSKVESDRIETWSGTRGRTAPEMPFALRSPR